jgi:hypothetical protein
MSRVAKHIFFIYLHSMQYMWKSPKQSVIWQTWRQQRSTADKQLVPDRLVVRAPACLPACLPRQLLLLLQPQGSERGLH